MASLISSLAESLHQLSLTDIIRVTASRDACVACSHARICHAAKCAQSCICCTLQDAFVLRQCDAQ
eukprot:1579147-Rhodomonas_salina.2